MILAAHAVLGAAAAQLFPGNPLLAFTAGFVSHFLTDAIPHWDYKLASKKENDENPMSEDMAVNINGFLSDIAKIGLDAAIGLGISYAVFSLWLGAPLWLVLVGAFAGILPDPLQFAYWKWRREPLISLQRFHLWVHTKSDTKHKLVKGLMIQIALSLAAVLVFLLATYLRL